MRKIPTRKVNPLGAGLHGGKPYQIGGRALLDFSTNINPLGPPESVLNALRRHLPAVAHYPDHGCIELRKRLASRHEVDLDHIVVGNGTNQLIHEIVRKARPRQAVIVEPTYSEYMRACLNYHVKREHWLAEGPHFDLEPFDPGQAELVWLCNPNNPTGRLWPQDRLVRWIQSFPKKSFVVDESFLPFREDEPRHSLIQETLRLKNLIVLRSMTKFFTLPGLRLGYLVANPSRFMDDSLPFWSVNALAQIAGTVALEDKTFAKRTHTWLRTEGDVFLKQIRSFPFNLDPIPTEANFILIRLRGIQSQVLARRLLSSGIALRVAGSFVGLGYPAHYVRVAIRTREENQQLVEALKSILVSEG